MLLVAADAVIVGPGSIAEIEEDWTVQEESTPVAPGDSSGSVGEVDVNAGYGVDSEFLAGNDSIFVDDELGYIPGYVSDLTVDGPALGLDRTVSMSLTTPLQKLNAERTVPPLAPGTITSPRRQLTNVSYRGGSLNPAGTQFYDINGNIRSWPNLTLIATVPAISANQVFVDESDAIYYISGGRVDKYDSGLSLVGSIIQSDIITGSVDDSGVYLYVDPGGSPRIYSYDSDLNAIADWDPGVSTFAIAAEPGTERLYAVAGYNTNPTSPNNPPGGLYFTRWNDNGSPSGGITWTLGFVPYHIRAHIDSNNIMWVSFTNSPTGTERFLQAFWVPGLPSNPDIVFTPVTDPIYIGEAYSNQITLWGSWARGGVYASMDDTVAGGGIDYTQKFMSQEPYLDEYMQYLGSLCGVDFTWNAGPAPSLTPLPWTGNVWTKLKEITAAYGLEITPALEIRQAGSEVLDFSMLDSEESSASLQLDLTGASRSVSIDYYRPDARPGTIYSAELENRIFRIDLGERISETVTTRGYVTFIQKENPISYSVLDSTGADATTVWRNEGGSVSAQVNPISSDSIDLTIVAPASMPGLTGPFSIAEMVGDQQVGDLNVRGFAIYTNPDTAILYTGADPDITTESRGIDITNSYIDTKERAYDRGIWAVVGASGPQMILRFSLPTSALEGFGVTPGALVSFRDSIYRIRTLNIGRAVSSATATRHITVADMIWQPVEYDVPLQNLVLNPNPEINTTGYVSDTFTNPPVRTAGAGVDGSYGAVGSMTATTSTNPNHGAGFGRSNQNDIPVTPGDQVTPSLYVSSNRDKTRMRLRIHSYNAANAQIGAYNDTVELDLVANSAPVRIQAVPTTVIANATHMNFRAVSGSTATEPWFGTRTNRFGNPVFAGFSAGSFNAVNSTETVLTQEDGTDFGAQYALRATRTTTNANRTSFIVGTQFTANSLHTLRFKLRSSTNIITTGGSAGSGTTFLMYRPDYTTTTNTVNIPFPPGGIDAGVVYDIAVTFTTSSATTIPASAITIRTESATTGAPSAQIGSYIEVANFSVELGDTTTHPIGFFAPSIPITGRTIAFTGTVNNSTSTLSADTLTISRVSSAPGPYFDGSFPGAYWDSSPYASISIQPYSYFPVVSDFDGFWDGYECRDFKTRPRRI